MREIEKSPVVLFLWLLCWAMAFQLLNHAGDLVKATLPEIVISDVNASLIRISAEDSLTTDALTPTLSQRERENKNCRHMTLPADVLHNHRTCLNLKLKTTAERSRA